MVRFVDVANMRRWLVETGIEKAIEGIAETIAEDFRRWELFDKTARVASHSEIGVIELMPASDGRQYGFKYVNGHPSNPSRGLQTVTAFGVLADVDSGYPTLWTEMTILTALRTAATSAVVHELAQMAEEEKPRLFEALRAGVSVSRIPSSVAQLEQDLRDVTRTLVARMAAAEPALVGATAGSPA